MFATAACAAPIASPTLAPSPSSTAAFQACHAILDTIPGLTAWTDRARLLVPAVTDEFSGVNFNERIKGYQLLKLAEDYDLIDEAIMLRSADLRQQGPGCIATGDALHAFANGLLPLAAQRLVCALVVTPGNAFAGSAACPDLFGYANASNRLAPWRVYDTTFADPTPEDLQSLQAWPKKLGVGADLAKKLNNQTQNRVCDFLTGAFEVQAVPLAWFLQYVTANSYQALTPELSEMELPSLTRDLYYGTQTRKNKLINYVDSQLNKAGQQPLRTDYSFLTNQPELTALPALCADVDKQVGLIGRAIGDTALPYSSGYYGVVVSGLAGCASGAFGSDTVLCYQTRVFNVIPKLITALLDLNSELGKISTFRLVSELE